eukprot:958780-Rhodomonas_salina.1
MSSTDMAYAYRPTHSLCHVRYCQSFSQLSCAFALRFSVWSSSYALAMRCPVLTQHMALSVAHIRGNPSERAGTTLSVISLRAYYLMPGSKLAYGVMRRTELAYGPTLSAICLRACYAMPGSALCFGAMRCSVPSWRMVLRVAQYCLNACYAMPVLNFCMALRDARY